MQSIRVNNQQFDVLTEIEGGASIRSAERLPTHVTVDVDGEHGRGRVELLDIIDTTYGERFLYAVWF